MLKTLIFDMGNVLLFFDHSRALVALGKLYDRSPEQVQEFFFATGLEWEYEKGLVSTEELHARFKAFSGKNEVSLADLAWATSDIFQPNLGMIALLRRVKAKGYRLVLLSNTSPAHIAFIREQYDFLPLFDELVLSHDVKSMKPEAKIFEAALGAAKVSPLECFYVDDIPEYIAAAMAHGIPGTVFSTVAAYEAALSSFEREHVLKR